MKRPSTWVKNGSSIVMGLLFISGFISACSDKEQSWERIIEEGQLNIGLDPSFPPFEATDGTNVYGIDVDLANAITAELGLEPNFIHFGYDGLYDALMTNQVDVLISALVIFPERTKDFKYSESYFDAGQVLASVRSPHFESLDDLGDETIGVELGAEGHILALDWQRQRPSLTLAPYSSAEEALNSLITAEVDLTIVDKISALLYAASTEMDLELLEISSEPFAMAVREEDTLLLDKLNSALQQVEKSGQLEKIIDSWLNE